MPPIQLSRSERVSLQRIVERACHPGEFPSDHEEKFLNYGLVRRNVLLLSVTQLGQCELLRQRFRGMVFPKMPGEGGMGEDGSPRSAPIVDICHSARLEQKNIRCVSPITTLRLALRVYSAPN